MGSVPSIGSKFADLFRAEVSSFNPKNAAKTIHDGGASIATVQNVTPQESAELESELQNQTSPPNTNVRVVHVPPPDGEAGPGSAVVVIGADAEPPPQANPDTGVVTASFNGQQYAIDPANGGTPSLVAPPPTEPPSAESPPSATLVPQPPSTSQPPVQELVDPASEGMATGNDHGTLPLHSPDPGIQMWSVAKPPAPQPLRGSGNDHGTLPG